MTKAPARSRRTRRGLRVTCGGSEAERVSTPTGPALATRGRRPGDRPGRRDRWAGAAGCTRTGRSGPMPRPSRRDPAVRLVPTTTGNPKKDHRCTRNLSPTPPHACANRTQPRSPPCSPRRTDRPSRGAGGAHAQPPSRPVAAPFGDGWLRLVRAPVNKAGGKLWEGPRDAEAALPPAVPRPRLHGHRTWTVSRPAGLPPRARTARGPLSSPRGRCEVAIYYSYNRTPTPTPAEFDVHPLAVEPVLLALPTDHAGRRLQMDARWTCAAWPTRPG